MERNERLKAADKCASIYTDENEVRIARKAFMLGCEFEAQGEIIKGVILDTKDEQPSEDLDAEIDRLWESFADEMEGPHNLFDIYARLARHFAKWGAEHAKKGGMRNG